MQMLEDGFGITKGKSESASSSSAMLVTGVISQRKPHRGFVPSAVHDEAPPPLHPKGQPLIGLPPRTYKTQGPAWNEEAHGFPTSVEEQVDEGVAVQQAHSVSKEENEGVAVQQHTSMSQEENGSLEEVPCARPLDTVLLPKKKPFNHANTAPGDLRQCCYSCRKVLVFALMESNGQICKCRQQKASTVRHYST